MAGAEKAMEEARFASTIGSENQCQKANRQSLSLRKWFEVTEAQSREHGASSWFADTDAVSGHNNEEPVSSSKSNRSRAVRVNCSSFHPVVVPHDRAGSVQALQ